MGYSHLLVLHTDNGSFHKTKYVIDIVLALRQSGYKVYLMTTSCTVQYINEVPIKVILAWFPRTIFGYCRKEMTIMRSIILAIYASWYPPKKEPTYVICDGSLFTIPILKYYGFYVTFVNYMVSFHHLMTKHSSIKPTPLQLSLLQRADEIIVPSRQCKLCLSHYEIHKGTVIMPCFNRNLYAYTNFVPIPEPKLVSIPYMFTVFGEFKKSSNFSMVIEAFKDLKFMLDDEKYFSKTRLVFVGRTDTLEEKEEYERVKNVLNNAEEEIAGKIFLFDVSDFGRIKTFLRESIALLDITENTLFNIMVIRAQSLGKCFYFIV